MIRTRPDEHEGSHCAVIWRENILPGANREAGTCSTCSKTKGSQYGQGKEGEGQEVLGVMFATGKTLVRLTKISEQGSIHLTFSLLC